MKAIVLILVSAAGLATACGGALFASCPERWDSVDCGRMQAYLNMGARDCALYIEREFRAGGRCFDGSAPLKADFAVRGAEKFSGYPVFVNGQYAGDFPLVLSLDPGFYTLELKHPSNTRLTVRKLAVEVHGSRSDAWDVAEQE